GCESESGIKQGRNQLHIGEGAEPRHSAIEFESAGALQCFEQVETNAVILSLDTGNFRSQAVFQHIILVREHLHGLGIGQRIFKMVENEDPDTIFRIVFMFQPWAQLPDYGAECVFLNMVKKAFLGFEIVVEPGERHAAAAREIAHGCALVTLVVKNISSVSKDIRELLVESRTSTGIAHGTVLAELRG